MTTWFRHVSGIVFVLAFALSTRAADEGLIAHWTFDDSANAGANAADSRFSLTAKSPLKIVSGVSGGAVELSSKAGAVAKLEAPQSTLPIGLSELTFAAWVAPKSLVGDATILRKEDVGRHGNDRLLFAIQNSGKFLTLGINCGGNYAECDALIAPEELLDGRWHHVAGTFDGHTMRVFLDGREIGAFERQTGLTTVHDYTPLKVWRDTVARSRHNSLKDATVRGEPFTIGYHVGAKGALVDAFDGKLDEIRFYSKALTAAQIVALHASGNQPATAPDGTDRQLAKKLYVKKATFLETLAATGANISNAATIGAVELQRLLRADFPAEVNDYIAKWQKNPVENLFLDGTVRRARAEALVRAEGKNPAPAFEYLPLTDAQWSVLPAAERAQWERAKFIREQLAIADAPVPAAFLYELENLVEERPKDFEFVAPYVAPTTPLTADRDGTDARKVIEADWLFQCGGKPTVASSLQEIGWARALAARLNVTDGTDRLAALEAQAKAKDPAALDEALYFAVRTLKREIMFKNPLLDFDTLLYTDSPNPQGREWQHETRHRLGYMAVPGGRLLVQKGLSPDGHLTQLAPTAPLHGAFWRPDISFDAKKVLFAFKPHNEKTFHIYEIGLDGTGLRQLTGGTFDDFDPVYLPDGKNIMFLTTRGHIYVRCMPPTGAFVMARMALDTKFGDKSLYITSRNGEPEYTPSVMHDGRVIYTRWEYTDKPLWRAQSLWTMRQDATNVQTFWGNQSVWPDLLKDARQIPGSNRVMFTGSAHHDWFAGSVGIIDPSKGLNFPDGLTKVTADIEWPECGKPPLD
ncbi:MAG: hypothetical protein LBV28_05480, partial [Puniceicoccales bacterium]|nr:hypothetical protein [Puniceicoccales bacterium]